MPVQTRYEAARNVVISNNRGPRNIRHKLNVYWECGYRGNLQRNCLSRFGGNRGDIKTERHHIRVVMAWPAEGST